MPAKSLLLLFLAAALGAQSVELRPRYEAGQRLTDEVRASLVLDWLDGEAGELASYDFESRRHIWLEELADGRPTRLVVAWESLRGQRLDRDGERSLFRDDVRPGLVLAVAVADSVTCTASAPLLLPAQGADLAAEVAADWEGSRLLPGKSVRPGATWEVPVAALAPPHAVLEDWARPQQGALTVTFEELREDGLAVLTYTGTLTWEARYADGTLARTALELVGEALVDPSSGLIRARTESGSASLRRTAPDGTERRAEGFFDQSTQRSLLTLEVHAPAAWPAPSAAEGFRAFPRALPDDGLLVVRQGAEWASLALLDRDGSFLHTLAVFPPGVAVRQLAVDPSGRRLAFASTLNNEVSLADWNLFALDLEDGGLAQLTPGWARGDSLAVPAEVRPRAWVRGSVRWRDRRGQLRRDLVGGLVELDGTARSARLDGDGRFELRDIPAGAARLRVRVTVLREDGERSLVGHFQPDLPVGVQTDLGVLELTSPDRAEGYGYPRWEDSTHIFARRLEQARTVFISIAPRGVQELDAPALGELSDLCASPDGRWWAGRSGPSLRLYDADERALQVAFPCSGPPAEGLAWTADSSTLLNAEEDARGWPALRISQPARKQSLVLERFPSFRLGARGLRSPAPTAGGDRIVAVLQGAEGRLLVWDLPERRLRLLGSDDIREVVPVRP